MWCMQFVELAYQLYEQHWWYAGLLLSITVLSSIFGVAPLYAQRLQLYKSVASRHIVPIVQAGYVR